MHEAGSDTIVGYTKSELMKFIIDAKGIPVQRNSIYTKFKRYDDDEDPYHSMIQLPLVPSSGE